MNPIVAAWKKDMKRSVVIGAVITAVLGAGVLLAMTAFPLAALAWPFVLLLGGVFIVPAVWDYRRNMALWSALPDDVRREVNALCAEEHQHAYHRLLRGYLTPHGMLTREGFFPWEHIVSISFWEKGRKFSRAADWWNVLSWIFTLFGGADHDRIDPESPAQCRVTVREGTRTRTSCLPLDPQSFQNDGVECLIADLKQASPVKLNIL